MEELNTTNSVLVTDQEGFDTLTCTDMGEAFSMAQVDEQGNLQDVVIGPEQAQALLTALYNFVNRGLFDF